MMYYCMLILRMTILLISLPPAVCCVLSPFRGGGIAYLSDPDSYAGWCFYTPVRTTQARQVEG